jgi:hypothetical protein
VVWAISIPLCDELYKFVILVVDGTGHIQPSSVASVNKMPSEKSIAITSASAKDKIFFFMVYTSFFSLFFLDTLAPEGCPSAPPKASMSRHKNSGAGTKIPTPHYQSTQTPL